MPPKLTARERELVIIQRRADRVPFRVIAAEVGVCTTRVHQVWTKALNKVPVARIDEHRTDELELCDIAVNELLVLARSPRAGIRSRVEAWNAIRGWSERKAKLLGLDAPNRTQVTLNDFSSEQLTQNIRELEISLGLSPGEELA